MAKGSLTATFRRTAGRYPDPKFLRAIVRTNNQNRRVAFSTLQNLIVAQGVRTGELRDSLDSYLTRDGFALTSDADQAWYREYGTGVHGPMGRPYWITPLSHREQLARREYSAAKRVKEATGTWPKGVRRNPHAYLRWFSNGRPIFATQVLAPGMRSEPSFGPALFGNADNFAANYEMAIVRTWMRD